MSLGSLSVLPPEILTVVLDELTGNELVRLMRVSKGFYKFIRYNRVLWGVPDIMVLCSRSKLKFNGEHCIANIVNRTEFTVKIQHYSIPVIRFNYGLSKVLFTVPDRHFSNNYVFRIRYMDNLLTVSGVHDTSYREWNIGSPDECITMYIFLPGIGKVDIIGQKMVCRKPIIWDVV